MIAINLLTEARTLMENTHSYDSEIAHKIDYTMDGIEKGKKYSEMFYKSLLYDSLELFEHTHCEEIETYQKIDEYLEGK